MHPLQPLEETEPEAETEAGAHAETELHTQGQGEVHKEVEAEAEEEIEVAAEAEAEVAAEAKAEVAAEAGAEVAAEAEVEAEKDAEREPQNDQEEPIVKERRSRLRSLMSFAFGSSYTRLPEETPANRVWWGDLVGRNVSSDPHVHTPRPSDVEYHAGRGQWHNKAEFILSCMGMSVGLGNVWRFPYLAYENGGAAFLVAYTILQFLVGKPMYFMELALAQFCAKGPTKWWDMNPAAKGIGFSMCVAALNIGIYYNVIMCYTLYFFFASMQGTLPWTVCLDEWKREDNCVVERFPTCTDEAFSTNKTCTCTGNSTFDTALPFKCVESDSVKTSAELYFYKSVLHQSAGLEPENIGTPLPRLTACLLLSWTIVVVCLIKGIKSAGKVVYFTATFPYFILIILLIRVSMLDGAVDGAKFFLIPEWSKLKDLKVWTAAAGQMFFSLGVTFGGIIMFASYNRFRNPVYKDALIVASMDLMTSVLGSLVVFTTFGVMAKKVGSTIEKVARSGYGLAFVVYPEALSHMPPAHLWSLLFFFMLFTLGLDSEFGFMETILTCIQDEFPKLRKYKSWLCVVLCVASFHLALPCVCPGGDHVVALMDHFGGDFAILILAFFEVVAVMWGYGVNNVLNDLQYMVGHRPRAWQYWMFCWVIVCPGIIAFLFTYRMIDYQPISYSGDRPYPQFALNIGWALCSAVLLPIPIWFFYLLYQSFARPDITTWQERRKFMFSPNCHWIPNDGRSVVGSTTDLIA